MAKHHSTIIPPFPSEIDRDYFGAWLSGLTDGEGCFTLEMAFRRSLPTLRAMFSITLREDDAESLKMIQSYLQCGRIHMCSRRKIGNANPMVVFRVSGTKELHNIIVSNFFKYPLIAKKKRDFEIWREAVCILYRILRKPLIGRGNCKGTLEKWSEQDRRSFGDLVILLKETRKYGSQYKGVSQIINQDNVNQNGLIQKNLMFLE